MRWLSKDPVERRRLAAVSGLVAALLALLIAIVTAGGSGDEPPRRAPEKPRAEKLEKPRELPLAQQVGQLLVMSYDEQAPPRFVTQRLRDRQGTGVILFSKNVASPEQLGEMTTALQRAAGGGALVAVDQEGGDIRSVPFIGPESSQASLTTPDAVSQSATEATEALREAGVNVDLGPIADVASPAGSVMSGRAFAGEASDVSDLVAAAVRAHDGARVAATPKHFPGLGSATASTDDQSVTVSTPRDELETNDLAPFRSAIDAKAPLMMVSHALYPELDPDVIASQSRPIVGGLLRRELGFGGVVVTDSIEAQAVLDRGTVAEAAEASVEAGVDLILMTGSGSWNEVYPALLRRAKSDPEFRARVKRSSDRVLALKRRLGLKGPG